ncbi:hypothetical protein B0H13DRAFT_2324564 [Mycena leptocephala]|nr:hypothetical protein B0H13DRAFT_2324564 [Mycena leptocephala]
MSPLFGSNQPTGLLLLHPVPLPRPSSPSLSPLRSSALVPVPPYPPASRGADLANTTNSRANTATHNFQNSITSAPTPARFQIGSAESPASLLSNHHHLLTLTTPTLITLHDIICTEVRLSPLLVLVPRAQHHLYFVVFTPHASSATFVLVLPIPHRVARHCSVFRTPAPMLRVSHLPSSLSTPICPVLSLALPPSHP